MIRWKRLKLRYSQGLCLLRPLPANYFLVLCPLHFMGSKAFLVEYILLFILLIFSKQAFQAFHLNIYLFSAADSKCSIISKWVNKIIFLVCGEPSIAHAHRAYQKDSKSIFIFGGSFSSTFNNNSCCHSTHCGTSP